MLAGVVDAVLAKRQNSTLTAADVGGVIRPADDHAVAHDVDLGVHVTSGAVLCPDLHEPVSLIADHFGSAASLGAPAAVDAGLKLEPAFSLELGVSLGFGFGNLGVALRLFANLTGCALVCLFDDLKVLGVGDLALIC